MLECSRSSRSEFEINVCYSAYEQSLSFRTLPCFYLWEAISSRSLHTRLRNPIKTTDCILSPYDLYFGKIYKCSLIMWQKQKYNVTINFVWYLFYWSVCGAAVTCNSTVLLVLNILDRWFVLLLILFHIIVHEPCPSGMLFVYFQFKML